MARVGEQTKWRWCGAAKRVSAKSGGESRFYQGRVLASCSFRSQKPGVLYFGTQILEPASFSIVCRSRLSIDV